MFILCGIALDPTWPARNPSVASSCPAISRIVVARLDGPAASCTSADTDVEVQRARVDLADAGQHPAEAEMLGDPLLERGELVGVAVEQVELVLRGPDRALDAAQRIALEQRLDPLDRHQQLVGGRGEPLAERRRLRRDVVAAAGDHQVDVLGGQPGQPGQRGDRAVADQLERRAHLQLLDVLGEVAAGHALVDVLVTGQRAELLDPRLHVVPRDGLAAPDRVEVDVVDDLLVRLDRPRPGTSTPRSRCASSTAIHSRRSSTTLCSGDQIRASSALA